MQKSIETIVNLMVGLGILNAVIGVFGFLARYIFTSRDDRVEKLEREIDKIWEAHNRCDIDKITERTAFIGRELERLEDRINERFNGKHG